MRRRRSGSGRCRFKPSFKFRVSSFAANYSKVETRHSKPKTMRKFILLFALLFSIASIAQSNSSLAQRRAAHLRHGINFSEWFAQVYDPKGYTKEHLETWVTADDIALINTMQFDHVRLSVNPQPMFRRKQADRIPEDYLGYLDAAVKMVLDQGLTVIIDIHPESDFKEKLASDNEFVEQFADFWRALR